MSRRIVSATICALAITTLLSFPGQAGAADPTTADCLSANETSITLLHAAQLRAARAQMLVCAAPNCPADVRVECVRRISEVNVSLPTIVFVAKDPMGNDLPATTVTMDGEVLAERLDGTAIPLDPGEHTFVFEATGQPPLSKQMLIREGEKNRRELVQLGSSAQPAPVPPSESPTDQPLAPATPRHGVGGQKVLALVATGVGIAGVAVGTVFGLESMSKHDDAVGACPGACPNQHGVTLWNQARSAGDASTVAFVVGGVGLAGGAVLWFTAGAPEESTTAGLRLVTREDAAFVQADHAASGGRAVRSLFETMTIGVGPGSLQVRGVW